MEPEAALDVERDVAPCDEFPSVGRRTQAKNSPNSASIVLSLAGHLRRIPISKRFPTMVTFSVLKIEILSNCLMIALQHKCGIEPNDI